MPDWLVLEYSGGYASPDLQGPLPPKGYVKQFRNFRPPPTRHPKDPIVYTDQELKAILHNQQRPGLCTVRKREFIGQQKPAPGDRYRWINPNLSENRLISSLEISQINHPPTPETATNFYRKAELQLKPRNHHILVPNVPMSPNRRTGQRDTLMDKLFRTQSRPVLGLDCEMVGVGVEGKKHALARVSIVDKGGRVVFDSYVRPHAQVTDYRTFVSGIEEHHLRNAPTFSKVRMEVVRLVSKSILVGHGLENDLKILRLEHPPHFIRDTAYYEPIRKLVSMTRCPPLKLLVEHLLEESSFQKGAHDPCQDAYAPVRLYLKFREEWDRAVCEAAWDSNHSNFVR